MRLPGTLAIHATCCLLVTSSLLSLNARGEELLGIENPLHGYYTRTTRDRFARLQEDLAAERRTLDTTGELALLRSVLDALEVPVSSQMLVYSVTSFQKRLISPRRPRALYFNEDTYVGYVPGGQIEVVSLDPDLGGVFYIFDRLTRGRIPNANRTEDCMTCHAPRYMENIPGLVIESVVPGVTGGGEKAFRREQSGHGIPLDLRFGGWHLTGVPGDFPSHWANRLIEYVAGEARERPIAIGELFDVNRYPIHTSDILPQLLHEHQVGFVNRALQAAYRSRVLLSTAGTDPSPELDKLANGLVRYLLFADEVPLPGGGIAGDSDFRTAFLAHRRSASNGAALKDLELHTRLLKYRCSYMIYSPTFTGLPAPLKQRVYAALLRALTSGEPEYAYLPQAEKQSIRQILTETIGDLPPEWHAALALSE